MAKPITPEALHQCHRWIRLDEVAALPGNPNQGHEDSLATSIDEFGWIDGIVVHQGLIVAGHHRVDQARARGHEGLPGYDLSGFDIDDARRMAMALAHNATTRAGADDPGLLASALIGLADVDPVLADAAGLGLASPEVQALVDVEPDPPRSPPDSIPDRVEGRPAVTEVGDRWQLGNHVLVCGDSTDPATLARLMGGEQATVVHADPPYGMNKGIANDHLHGPRLDVFQMAWWQTCRPHLTDNASAYVWGNPEDLWRLWWTGGLRDSESLSFRSEIVWAKGSSGAGGNSHIGAEGLRQYPPETERCLFFMLGDQQASTNADEYWEGWEPIRSYLAGEVERLGWGPADTKAVTGVGMHSHWFSRSQWTMPTREHYEALQAAARGDGFRREYDGFRREYDGFRREYDEIRREYDEIHAEWMAQRAPFDNTHDNMTDVWDFPRVAGADRHGHETPKPVAMCERVHRTSARDGDIVLVPFAGTGPDFVAAHVTGRRCYGIELDPRWCDVVCERFEAATGVAPIRDGQPVSFAGR